MPKVMRYKKLKAEGRCGRCGTSGPLESEALCGPCLEKSRSQYQRWKGEGRCEGCGEPIETENKYQVDERGQLVLEDGRPVVVGAKRAYSRCNACRFRQSQTDMYRGMRQRTSQLLDQVAEYRDVTADRGHVKQFRASGTAREEREAYWRGRELMNAP